MFYFRNSPISSCSNIYSLQENIGILMAEIVGIDRFRRISDELVRRYRFVGKKIFVGISSELPTTF